MKSNGLQRLLSFLLSWCLLLTAVSGVTLPVSAATNGGADGSGFTYTSDGTTVTITGYEPNPTGAPFYGFMFDGHYYGVSTQSLSWTEAAEDCEANGGYLVSVNSAREQAAMEVLLRLAPFGNKWIGGHLVNGAWYWTDGTGMGYSNWDDGEPNGSASYACIYHNQYYFDFTWDDNNAGSYHYICEWESMPEDTVFALTSDLLTVPAEIDGVPVTAIGAYAFADDQYISTVELPDSVMVLGEYAFRNCTSLETVKLPSQLRQIGEGAFSGCSALTQINWNTQNSTVKLHEYNGHYYGVFCADYNWAAAKIFCEDLGGHLATVTSAQEQAYLVTLLAGADRTTYWLGGTDQTTEGTWEWITGEPFDYQNWTWNQPDNYQNNEDYLQIWNDDRSWNDSTHTADTVDGTLGFICEWESIPAETAYIVTEDAAQAFNHSLETIGAYAFSGCSSLKQLELPDSICSIGSRAFQGCTGLEALQLPGYLTHMGENILDGCTGVTQITVPAAVFDAAYAFRGSSIQRAFLEEGIQTAPWGMFRECTALETVVLPETLTEVGGYLFAGCTSLNPIALPDSVTVIGEHAFQNCTALEMITLPTQLTQISEGTFSGCSALSQINWNTENRTLKLHAYNGNYYGVFCAAYSWEGAKAFCEAAGGHLATVTSAQEQAYLVTLLADADRTTYWLGGTDRTQEGTWEWITGEPFDYQNWTWNQPDNYQNNEDYLQIWNDDRSWNDSTLTADTVDGTLGFICEWEMLPTEIAYTVTVEAAQAVNNPLETIGAYAFSGCSSLKQIDLPDTVCRLGSHAFEGCPIVQIEIPNSVLEMRYSLCGAEALETVSFANRTDIPAYALDCCSQVQNVVIPQGVETIYEYAFWGCSGLKDVTLPGTVNTVGTGAFEQCSGLTDLTFLQKPQSIAEYAFRGCTALERIDIQSIELDVINVRQYNGHYYAIFNSAQTWEDAKAICENYGGHLVTVTDAEEQDFIENLVTESGSICWCGGSDQVVEGIWSWINGEVWSYTNWEDGEPNNYGGDQDYLALYENGKWDDDSAYSVWPFICEWETDVSTAFVLNPVEEGESCRNDYPLSRIDVAAFEDCPALSDVYYPAAEDQWNTTYVAQGNEALINAQFHFDHEHTYGPWKTETAATCTSLGIRSRICSSCGNKQTETIPALAHSYSGSSCTVCGTKDPNSNVPLGDYYLFGWINGGNYGCEEDFDRTGDYFFTEGTLVASFDSDSYVAIKTGDNTQWYMTWDYVTETTGTFYNTELGTGEKMFVPGNVELTFTLRQNSDGSLQLSYVIGDCLHSYGTWITEREPTCAVAGSRYRSCENCGITESESIPALAHQYNTVVTAPTCTVQGYTKYSCTVCGASYRDGFIAAPGHRYGSWIIEREPSCAAAGSKHRLCSVCGDGEQETIPALEHTYTDQTVEPDCSNQGYLEHICAVCGYSYRDTYTPAVGHSYGDWIVRKAATILEEGIAYRTCTVCNAEETATIERLTADPDTDSNYGRTIFTVVHAQTLEPISGAQIYISTEKDGETTLTTDEKGQASIVLPVGKQEVSVYAANCLSRNLTATVNSGTTVLPSIGMSDLPTYEAELTHERMTIEEIEAAGIDTSDPSNQHVYKYELKLEFTPEIDLPSIITYFNSEGTYLGGFTDFIAPPPSDPGTPPEVVPPGEVEGSFYLHYHVINEGFVHAWCKEVSVEQGEHVSLTYRPWREGDDYIFDGWYEDPEFTTKVYAVDAEDPVTYVYGRWIYVGEEEEEPKPPVNPGIRIPYEEDGEEKVLTVYPVSEYFYLIVRGEVTWLKEMFDVEMLIINNSMTDTLEDLTATLTLPEGLSLAAMVNGEQSLVRQIDKIPEGESETLHWYVRGDKAGSYDLEARLQGMVMPYEEPIDDIFVSENQLQVWGGDALHLHFEFPDTAYYGEDYPITITLTNVSDITLYNINHKVQIEQGMQIYYSDGTVTERIANSSWESIGVRQFHPGDQLIIEASVNIFFESEVMKAKLQQLCDMVDGMEQFIEGYKAVTTALDLMGGMINCIGSCSKALGAFDPAMTTESVEKTKLFAALQGQISSLYSACTDSGSQTLDAAVKLSNTGLQGTLNAIGADPKQWISEHSLEDILKVLQDVKGLEDGLSDSGTREFNIFDSVRTAISAIPIRFVLTNVIMTEDPENTTSIPWSYSTYSTGARYFGVSSVSKYLRAIGIAAAAEVYDELMPDYLKLLPGLDDPMNKEEAIRYIQATEDEIALIKAKDATGEVTFRSWVVRSDMQPASPEDYTLSSDNETAQVDEDGVLTFTGDGTIQVTPNTDTDSILYIEDSAGNLYTYEIQVVEPHDCTPGQQEVILPPTQEHDGFAVRTCEQCDEVMEVIPLTADTCETHSFGDWILETAPGCEYSGIEHRSCNACSMKQYRYTDALGHSYESSVTQAPTCTREGIVAYTCIRCGDQYTEALPKAEHQYEQGVCIFCSTPESTGGYLSGTVFGVGDQTQTLNIVLCLPDGESIAHKADITDGEYLIENIIPGTYILRVSKDGYVPREYVLIIHEGENAQNVKLCRLGDVNGDGYINVGDVAILYAHAKGTKQIQDVYVLLCADVNSDAVVNVGDVAKVYGYTLGKCNLHS